MANLIKVDTDALRSLASAVDEIAESYNNQVVQVIMDTVTEMDAAWDGEASQQYITKIQGFYDDLVGLTTLLNKYETYLNNTAAKYDAIEQNIQSETSALSTGN
jgi:WXG100 family type VII secretion target